jgi:hypothetical protein
VRRLERLVQQPLRGDDAVHESQLERLRRRRHPRLEDHFEGARLPERAGMALRPARPGREALRHLRRADRGDVVRDVAQVAGQCELTRGAQSRAADRGDHDLVEELQAPEETGRRLKVDDASDG